MRDLVGKYIKRLKEIGVISPASIRSLGKEALSKLAEPSVAERVAKRLGLNPEEFIKHVAAAFRMQDIKLPKKLGDRHIAKLLEYSYSFEVDGVEPKFLDKELEKLYVKAFKRGFPVSKEGLSKKEERIIDYMGRLKTEPPEIKSKWVEKEVEDELRRQARQIIAGRGYSGIDAAAAQLGARVKLGEMLMSRGHPVAGALAFLNGEKNTSLLWQQKTAAKRTVEHIVNDEKFRKSLENTIKKTKDGYEVTVMRATNSGIVGRALESPATFFDVFPEKFLSVPGGYIQTPLVRRERGKFVYTKAGDWIGGGDVFYGKTVLKKPLVVTIPSGIDSKKMIMQSVADEVGFKWSSAKSYFENEQSLLKYLKKAGHDGVIIKRKLPSSVPKEFRGKAFPYQVLVFKGTEAEKRLLKSARRMSPLRVGLSLFKGIPLRLPMMVGAIGALLKGASALGTLDDLLGGALMPEKANDREMERLRTILKGAK